MDRNDIAHQMQQLELQGQSPVVSMIQQLDEMLHTLEHSRHLSYAEKSRIRKQIIDKFHAYLERI